MAFAMVLMVINCLIIPLNHTTYPFIDIRFDVHTIHYIQDVCTVTIGRTIPYILRMCTYILIYVRIM